MSMVGSPQRCVQKDLYTSDTSDLTITWRILGSRVVTNWFLRTNDENDDTRIVFSPCGIPSRNFFMIPLSVRNLHHNYQLPDCSVAVSLDVP